MGVALVEAISMTATGDVAIAMRPFTVKLNGHRFKFVPEDTGFSVQCLDRRGAISQGDSFEEAASNALDALAMIEASENDPWPVAP